MIQQSSYKTKSPEEIDHMLSNFLINSWSYSKLTQFARNEKAFEMIYIYNEGTKTSATTVAGQAYHYALDRFFKARQNKEHFDLPTLEQIAYEYIDEFPANKWKLQKTTPTIDECRVKCINTTNALLRNFFAEMSTYLDDIKEIIEVEISCHEWLVINGVEIPMPCHMKIDLVVLTVRDTIAIIDHKSKSTYTDEVELKLQVGVQAITYVLGYESYSGLDVGEVWFVENKYSQNKNGAKQLNAFILTVDEHVRRLYEAILYEPLKRMLEAVQDPDYVYLINTSDNFIDQADLHEFWAKTMIAEIEDFHIIDPKKRQLIERRLKKIRDTSIATANPSIIKKFKQSAADFIQYDLSNKNMTSQEKIEHILRSFGIIVRVAHSFDGYSSDTHLLEISGGVKVSSIYSHKLDLANALDVPTVRLSSAMVMHESKSFMGVEISKKREKSLHFEPSDRVGFKIPIGRDNLNNVIFWDWENPSTPHALACGQPGSGKSVCIRSVIEYALQAGAEKIYLLDPKYEFCELASDRIEVINEIIAIEHKMAELVEQMNTRVKNKKSIITPIIFDEFADAVAQSRKGNDLKNYEMVEIGNYKDGRPKEALKVVSEDKPLEENLRVLLQKGRSAGYRIMAATQRASVKVITGDAKVNFSVQICFKVPKEGDSRVVLDEAGGEALAGAGDGLIKSPEYSQTTRFQAYWLK